MLEITEVTAEARYPDLAECANIVAREGRPTAYPAGSNTTFLVYKVVGGDEESISLVQNHIIPTVSRVFSDKWITPAEAVDLINLLVPDYGKYTLLVLTALEEAAKAVSDDGKISRTEAMMIALRVIGKLV